MKIRIRGNSVRYRLTKSEVAKFSDEGYIEETTVFPNGMLKYALKTADVTHLAATFEHDTITMLFPDGEQKIWHDSSRVGYDHSLTLPNGDTLFLLLEKDFACLDNTLEDQSDNYDNPNAVC